VPTREERDLGGHRHSGSMQLIPSRMLERWASAFDVLKYKGALARVQVLAGPLEMQHQAIPKIPNQLICNG